MEKQIEVKAKLLPECRNKFRAMEFKLSLQGLKFKKVYPKNCKVGGSYVGHFSVNGNITPHKLYTDDKGNRLPSVTTVLKKCIPMADFILEWANGLGFKNIKYKEHMKDITETGNCVHEIIERYTSENMEYIDATILNKIFRENPFYSRNDLTIHKCFSQFMEWFNDLKSFDLISNELSLVSEKYRFGGTIDMVCMIDGRMTILDLKTSNSLDSKMLMQLAAYTILYEDNYPDARVDQVAILRMDKKDTNCREYMVISREEMDAFTEYFFEMLKFVEILENINIKFFDLLNTQVYYNRQNS
ncbi:MAG: PD-(D/E)XK nuclease family protein [Fusobacteriaceae bacterium]